MTTDVRRTVDLIHTTFASTPRPTDQEIGHDLARDDVDVIALFPFSHWSEIDHGTLEQEWAAIYSMSPDGFRHFIPAYMAFSLSYAGQGSAAEESTITALTPGQGWIYEYRRSQHAALTDPEALAVVTFLETITPHTEVPTGDALRAWRERTDKR
ncbi:MAG: hypothetical protein PVJ28_01790 [Acidimicrobiia bacterium]